VVLAQFAVAGVGLAFFWQNHGSRCRRARRCTTGSR